MDDHLLIDRLRADLRAEQAGSDAPPWLADAGRSRWRRRRLRNHRLAGAAVGLLLVAGVATAATVARDDGASVETRRWGAMATPTTAPEGPSQSPEDAARDGVDPALAALPPSERLARLFEVEAPPEGTYSVNQSPQPGAAPEVLVVDHEDRIVRAFPMGGLEPDWIDVTGEEVFGGRFADPLHAGSQPFATVFRIDRRTLELSGFAFAAQGIPAPLGRDGYVTTTADQWQPAPAGVQPSDLFLVGERPGWERAAPWRSEVSVDRNALRALFGLPPY